MKFGYFDKLSISYWGHLIEQYLNNKYMSLTLGLLLEKTSMNSFQSGEKKRLRCPPIDWHSSFQPWRLQLSILTEHWSSWVNGSALWTREEGTSCCSEWWGGWQQLFNIPQQTSERTSYRMTMGWICVRAAWHTMIRFRQSGGIYIQRQPSPRLGERGGQLSSSTSIQYVSIKKKQWRQTGSPTSKLPHR